MIEEVSSKCMNLLRPIYQSTNDSIVSIAFAESDAFSESMLMGFRKGTGFLRLKKPKIETPIHLLKIQYKHTSDGATNAYVVYIEDPETNPKLRNIEEFTETQVVPVNKDEFVNFAPVILKLVDQPLIPLQPLDR